MSLDASSMIAQVRSDIGATVQNAVIAIRDKFGLYAVKDYQPNQEVWNEFEEQGISPGTRRLILGHTHLKTDYRPRLYSPSRSYADALKDAEEGLLPSFSGWSDPLNLTR